MDANAKTMAQTIRCTEANQDEFRALVKSCDQLSGLVKGLQAQGVFPGLRGMSITVTGDERELAKGLGAWVPFKEGGNV